MKNKVVGGLLALSINIAQAQEMSPVLLDVLGFDKTEVPDCIREKVEKVDVDPTGNDVLLRERQGYTIVDNERDSTHQRIYMEKKVTRDSLTKILEMRLYKDDTGEYMVGVVDGVKLDLAITQQIITILCNTLPDLIPFDPKI